MKKHILLSVFALSVIWGGCSKEPTSVEDLRAAGKKAFLNQQYAEARKYFNKALNKASSDRDLLYFNGLAYKRDYIYDSALIFMKRADFIKKNDVELNREIYDLAKRTENWEYALQAIAVLTKHGGDPIQGYYRELAEFNGRNKQPLVAIYYQRKVVEMDSTNVDEMFRLVGIALSLDSLDVAEEYLNKAQALVGESDGILANRGMLYVHRQQYAEAEKIFRALVAKDSTSYGYRLNLANALSMAPDKGKKREALSLYRSLPEELNKQYKVDTLIMMLEKDLK